MARCADHAIGRSAEPKKKIAVQCPEANQGGREEEENGLGISDRKPERLHSAKTCGGATTG